MLPAFGHVAELRRSGLQQRPDWQAVPLDLHRIGQSKLNSLPHGLGQLLPFACQLLHMRIGVMQPAWVRELREDQATD